MKLVRPRRAFHDRDAFQERAANAGQIYPSVRGPSSPIVTIAEGDITHLHIGFKGTMTPCF